MLAVKVVMRILILLFAIQGNSIHEDILYRKLLRPPWKRTRWNGRILPKLNTILMQARVMDAAPSAVWTHRMIRYEQPLAKEPYSFVAISHVCCNLH